MYVDDGSLEGFGEALNTLMSKFTGIKTLYVNDWSEEAYDEMDLSLLANLTTLRLAVKFPVDAVFETCQKLVHFGLYDIDREMDDPFSTLSDYPFPALKVVELGAYSYHASYFDIVDEVLPGLDIHYTEVNLAYGFCDVALDLVV